MSLDVAASSESIIKSRSLLKVVLRDRLAAAGLVTLLLLVVAASLPAQWLPGEPFATSLGQRLKPPVWVEGGSWERPLGTDNLGRDILSRVMRAARVSLTITVLAVILSATMGIGLGVLAGFSSGRLDAVIMRLVDMQLAFPLILMIIAVVAVIGPSVPLLVLVLGLSGWGQYARLVRAETLKAKGYEFVEASRAVGNNTWGIVRKHVLPNISTTIIIFATFEAARILLLESAVSFLGLGVQPPTPSWGSMISDGRNYIYQGWWISTFSGTAVFLAVLSLNLVGDGLRDALDPRNR